MILDEIKSKNLILYLQTILTEEITKERVDALNNFEANQKND